MGLKHIDGLPEALAFAKQEGVQCIAVSNAPRAACECALEMLRGTIDAAGSQTFALLTPLQTSPRTLLVASAMINTRQPSSSPPKRCNADVIKGLVVGAECERPKPFPDPYLVAIEHARSSPSDCVVFEDSSSGGESPPLSLSVPSQSQFKARFESSQPLLQSSLE